MIEVLIDGGGQGAKQVVSLLQFLLGVGAGVLGLKNARARTTSSKSTNAARQLTVMQ